MYNFHSQDIVVSSCPLHLSRNMKSKSKLTILEVCLFTGLELFSWVISLVQPRPSAPTCNLYNDMGTQENIACEMVLSSVHYQPKNPIIFRKPPFGLHRHRLLGQLVKYHGAWIEQLWFVMNLWSHNIVLCLENKKMVHGSQQMA